MAGVVDACSFADDHAYPHHRSGLAAVYSGLQLESLFSAVDHLLDHPRNPSPHPAARGPASAVAWRIAGRRRCCDDFAAGVCDRSAGELFHLALFAGDYRREHLVLPANRFSSGSDLLSPPCGDDRDGLRGEDSAHLLKPAGEEILGHRFAELRGRRLQELNDDFWLPDQYENSERLSLRKEIDFLTPSGQVRYLGISISPLRSRDSERNGYVFNFQDLTDLRRLEQEVATKERMAALGRLSAAIAHEIRQP